MNIANVMTLDDRVASAAMNSGLTSWAATKDAATLAARTYFLERRDEFDNILGSRESQAFIASVLFEVISSPSLWKCDLDSIRECAMRVALLGLSVDPAIGEACIVPFKDTATHTQRASMIVMWKGYRTLAMNTGRYKNINACRVFEGESCDYDRLFGTYSAPKGAKKSERVIGWLAAFRLVDGFEMTDYWEIVRIHAHGQKHSKSYKNPFGWWKQHPEVMERKTVLRQLLCNWGPMKGSPKFRDDDDVVDGAVSEPAPRTTPFTREDYARQEARQ